MHTKTHSGGGACPGARVLAGLEGRQQRPHTEEGEREREREGSFLLLRSAPRVYCPLTPPASPATSPVTPGRVWEGFEKRLNEI